MGCGCAAERGEDLPFADNDKTDPSSATFPRKPQRKKARRVPEWAQNTAITNPVKVLRGPIEDMYKEVKELRSEDRYSTSLVTHTASAQLCILQKFRDTEMPRVVEIHRFLDHPHVIRAMEFLKDDECYYAVFENFECTLADKAEFLGPRTVDSIGKIMAQVMRALRFAHNMGVVHYNLNLSNIALKTSDLADPIVRVMNFGAAPQTFSKKSLKGSPYRHYVAPELLLGEESAKSDVWSCGVIMHVLITGFDVLKKAHRHQIEFPKHKWHTVPHSVKELVRAMLSRDGRNRPSPEEFLQHPWVRSLDTEMKLSSKPVRDTLSNMVEQKPSNALKEAIKSFILTRVYPQAELVKMARIFRAIDVDEDGKLSQKDIADVLKRVMTSARAESTAKKIMRKFDHDGNGLLTYSEFLLCAIEEEELLNRENVIKVFNLLDSDDSGVLTVEEIKRAFYVNGPEDVVHEMWKKAFAEVDQSGNGDLEYREFVDLCTRSLKKAGNA